MDAKEHGASGYCGGLRFGEFKACMNGGLDVQHDNELHYRYELRRLRALDADVTYTENVFAG